MEGDISLELSGPASSIFNFPSPITQGPVTAATLVMDAFGREQTVSFSLAAFPSSTVGVGVSTFGRVQVSPSSIRHQQSQQQQQQNAQCSGTRLCRNIGTSTRTTTNPITTSISTNPNTTSTTTLAPAPVHLSPSGSDTELVIRLSVAAVCITLMACIWLICRRARVARRIANKTRKVVPYMIDEIFAPDEVDPKDIKDHRLEDRVGAMDAKESLAHRVASTIKRGGAYVIDEIFALDDVEQQVKGFEEDQVGARDIKEAFAEEEVGAGDIKESVGRRIARNIRRFASYVIDETFAPDEVEHRPQFDEDRVGARYIRESVGSRIIRNIRRLRSYAIDEIFIPDEVGPHDVNDLKEDDFGTMGSKEGKFQMYLSQSSKDDLSDQLRSCGRATPVEDFATPVEELTRFQNFFVGEGLEHPRLQDRLRQKDVRDPSMEDSDDHLRMIVEEVLDGAEEALSPIDPLPPSDPEVLSVSEGSELSDFVDQLKRQWFGWAWC